jgi:hypothetical protein
MEYLFLTMRKTYSTTTMTQHICRFSRHHNDWLRRGSRGTKMYTLVEMNEETISTSKVQTMHLTTFKVRETPSSIFTDDKSVLQCATSQWASLHQLAMHNILYWAPTL